MTPRSLTGGTVVTSLDPPRLERTDVTVEAGRISALGPAPEGASRLDCSGCLVVPGLVCAHHHLYSSLARGMPYRLEPPRHFLQVLQRVWWRLDRALDEETVRGSALAGGMDALLAGTTTVVDHHASPNFIEGSLDVVAGELEGLGLRSILCYEVTDRDGPERAGAGIEENRRFLRAASARPLTRAMVGAHASFTLSPETLEGCVELCRSEDAGLHVHVAEDGVDQSDADARFGKRAVHRLADAKALTDRSLLAHCIHLEESELEVVRSSGATAVNNPRSNMNNRVGHAPVRRFDRLGLGTDGIGGDVFAESKAAFWRARESDPTVGPEWVLGRLAEGARFAGSVVGEPALGRVEEGAPADLVVMDYDPPTPLEEDGFAAHWVFALSSGMVRDVMVAGRFAVRDGRLVEADGAELRARSRAAARRLWDRMATIEPHPFAPGAL